MKHAITAYRFVVALGFGFLAWAACLAALMTWLDWDPSNGWARALASLVGALFAWHVFELAKKHMKDVPRAIFFPLKFPFALAFAAIATWVVAVGLTRLAGVMLLGRAEGFGSVALLIVGAPLALFAVPFFEGVVLHHSDPLWFALPSVVVRSARYVGRHLPSASELGERARQMFEDGRRGIIRRPDSGHVQSVDEARRRAESDE